MKPETELSVTRLLLSEEVKQKRKTVVNQLSISNATCKLAALAVCSTTNWRWLLLQLQATWQLIRMSDRCWWGNVTNAGGGGSVHVVLPQGEKLHLCVCLCSFSAQHMFTVTYTLYVSVGAAISVCFDEKLPRCVGVFFSWSQYGSRLQWYVPLFFFLRGCLFALESVQREALTPGEAVR